MIHIVTYTWGFNRSCQTYFGNVLRSGKRIEVKVSIL